jgi:hypothetical protein
MACGASLSFALSASLLRREQKRESHLGFRFAISPSTKITPLKLHMPDTYTNKKLKELRAALEASLRIARNIQECQSVTAEYQASLAVRSLGDLISELDIELAMS